VEGSAAHGRRYGFWMGSRAALVVVTFGLVPLLAGCTTHAWEREKLAHPTMTADEISIGLDGHVRAVSEGATGGLAGAGGGCGCN